MTGTEAHSSITCDLCHNPYPEPFFRGFSQDLDVAGQPINGEFCYKCRMDCELGRRQRAGEQPQTAYAYVVQETTEYISCMRANGVAKQKYIDESQSLHCLLSIGLAKILFFKHLVLTHLSCHQASRIRQWHSQPQSQPQPEPEPEVSTTVTIATPDTASASLAASTPSRNSSLSPEIILRALKKEISSSLERINRLQIISQALGGWTEFPYRNIDTNNVNLQDTLDKVEMQLYTSGRLEGEAFNGASPSCCSCDWHVVKQALTYFQRGDNASAVRQNATAGPPVNMPFVGPRRT